MAGVLQGLRVVDFGQYIAGPLAAVMLADQGADVVHIDPPGGPRWKSPADAFFNRSKRRIVLDLKQLDDLAIARRLVERADVAIENFRPGVMDRLGLGSGDTTRRHPRLIYCSLPGFAADDPRAGLPAWEGVVAAATENCRLRTGEVPEGWDSSRPTYNAIPVASSFAAFLAASAILMALVSRHRTGLGQRIEVPLFDAMFEAIGGHGTYRAATGWQPERTLDSNGGGTFRCSDGRYVRFHPGQPRFITWFAHAAGVDGWAAEGLLDELRLPDGPLRARLTELFLTRTAHEWDELGNRVGLPLAMVRSSAEWIGTEHARASAAVVQVEDPELGPTWMAGTPVHLTSTPGPVPGPRHLPNADRADILAELDRVPVAPTVSKADREVRAPLEGMRVVDLTQVLAGPIVGRMLGEYGAEVFKIGRPHASGSSHVLVNRGKHTILLDVQSARGQQVFWKLVEEADVVTQNFPLGTAERYGIGYEQVRARRPDIVYVSVSCYGYGGPWGAGRGYELQGQAATGMMERCGGDGRPKVLGPYQQIDYGTGALGTFAASLGIYHRVVTGQGQHVQTSLAQAGTYLQAAYLLDYPGRVSDEPQGPWALGAGALQRFYHAEGGWFFLGASPKDLSRLAGIEGLGEVEGLPGSELEGALERCFSRGTVATWVSCLQRAGLGAHRVVKLRDLMVEPLVRARGLSITQLTDESGEVTMPGLAVRMSATQPRVGKPVGRPGADAAAVLRRIGMEGAREELERAWALQVSGLPSSWRY